MAKNLLKAWLMDNTVTGTGKNRKERPEKEIVEQKRLSFTPHWVIFSGNDAGSGLLF